VAALIWLWLLDDLMLALVGAPLREIVLGLLYPVLDVLTLVVVTVVIVRRSSYRFDPRLVIFSLAFACQAIGDLSYAMTAIGEDFVSADPNYAAYLMASLGFVVSARMVARAPVQHEYAERRPPFWSLIGPYGSAAVVVGALSIRIFRYQPFTTDHVLYLAALAVGILVILRQSVAITENRVLVEGERADFVSSISHELRTPLTSMVGFLSLMDDRDTVLTDDEHREMLGIARQQAEYMGRVVTDMVVLARDDPALLPLERRVVCVPELVGEAIKMAGPWRRAVEVPDHLEVEVDRERLIQVLTNLLTNAERYGGSHHLVKAWAEGQDLVLEVHDSGLGVPVRFQLSIWNRFERGANRFNAKIPGSGIGLAIVALIIRAHGGSVGYETSRILGGACFQVRIPGCVLARQLDGAELTHPQLGVAS
jgi:signal transduction histidine kinase